jgi:hypothetical protein
MSIAEKEKVSYVTYDGRTIVNTNALLQDPGVRDTISKLVRAVKRDGKIKVLRKK